MKNIKPGTKDWFVQQLLHWHQHTNTRALPWKEEKNPYKIWLSEIILQQTRAEQGLPYYNAFIEKYPDINKLADAEDEEVYKLWQGLGYYNRCKNMLVTACYIQEHYKGVFPKNYEDILALKGVGAYTAAAIASFAYNLPHAVVDGNVYRVLSRYFSIELPVDSTQGKKAFTQLAQDLLPQNESAAYNQSIMDFGATVCTPKNPQCGICPLSRQCLSYGTELVNLLPVKLKKIKVSERYFNYIIFRYRDQIWVRKREQKDIWQNLFEGYLLEMPGPVTAPEISGLLAEFLETEVEQSATMLMDTKIQKLTHQKIHAHFYIHNLKQIPKVLKEKGIWVKENMLKKIAFPGVLVSFYEKSFYF